MKLFAFALLALGSAQEVYDPDNCTNGNGRCDAQCNTAFGSREQCNSGNRIDRACCTVQEACVLVSDDANVDCGSFPVVLEGAACKFILTHKLLFITVVINFRVMSSFITN